MIRRLLVFITIAAIGFLTTSVFAESLSTLTLEQAVEIAIINNPQLKVMQARVDMSRARTVTAGIPLNPAIFSDIGIAEDTYRVIGLEQTFEMGGKRKRRVTVAKSEEQVALAEAATELAQLKSNIRRAYAQLYVLKERASSFKAVMQAYQQIIEQAKGQALLTEEGFELLTAELQMIEGQNDVESIEHQLIEAHNQLALLLNQPLSPVIHLEKPTSRVENIIEHGNKPFSLPQLDETIGQLTAKALAQRTEIQQNNRLLETNEQQLMLDKANRIPNLTLAAGPDYTTGEPQYLSAFFMGKMDLPIHNRQKGVILETQAKQEELKHQQAALRNQITMEVANAYSALLTSQARLKRYEDQILPKSLKLVEQAKQEFQAGKVKALIPIMAQGAYLESEKGYLQALLDTQNAMSDLEKALGVP